VGHAQRKHALLSASSASRWMACPPSARLEDKVEDVTSEFAAEGTLAHELSEAEIRFAVGLINKRQYNAAKKKIELNALYSDEMPEEVAKYVEYCLDLLAAAKLAHGAENVLVSVEEKIDLTEYIEDGFGTGDFNIVADETLDVTDLKYGKGVRVSAKGNSQLMLYGLGLLFKYSLSFDIKTVRLTIVQPRLDSISTFEISAEELVKWGEQVVRPKAALAYNGFGATTPGEHCQFCKVKSTCRALANQNLELAKHEFADPPLLSDEELLDVFGKIDLLSTWAKSVSDYILASARGGKVWKGYKLIATNGRRVLKDEAAVLEYLEINFEKSQYLNEKIKGIGDLTKLLGKVVFAKEVEPFLMTPPGAPTLVEDSDPRPAMDAATEAKKAFKD
jgi:hypothetical protein